MNRIPRLVDRRRRLLGPAYRLFYDPPLELVRGEGAWLFDADGRRFLDAYNNVPHVGHCHPRVVEAIRTQAATLNTHTRYLHTTILNHAERLLARFPDSLDRIMYACSGTEANDLALRIAQSVTGNRGVIVTSHAYHGHSLAILPLSTEDTPPERRGDHVATLAAPDGYRSPFSPPEVAARARASVGAAVDALAARGHRPAALFLDTVLSSEGVPNIPDGWLAGLGDAVREAGGLLVADEVQAGFARTGPYYWGFEKLGGTPDLVTLGKPMGNGHPISAVVARQELLEHFARENHYFNTFGGNPVSCAAGLAVLQVMEEEKLQENACQRGAQLARGLAALRERYESMGDVRGSGLFQAVELVRDRGSKRPDSAAAKRIMNEMCRRGVLVGVTGPEENVLKIRPPMVIDEDQIEQLIHTLDSAMGAGLERVSGT